MHFSVLVITPHRPVRAGLDALLWPWCHSNPDLVHPRWDFFSVGGIYQALLDPDWSGEDPGRIWDFSQKQKKRLDVAHAADVYDRVQAALAGLRLLDLAELQRVHGGREWVPQWHADPAVKAVKSVTGPLSPESILSFDEPRDLALAKARRCAFLTSAIVRGDRWYDSDLWDWDEDPVRTEAWADSSDRSIADAAPNDWLTIVDCHR